MRVVLFCHLCVLRDDFDNFVHLFHMCLGDGIFSFDLLLGVYLGDIHPVSLYYDG